MAVSASMPHTDISYLFGSWLNLLGFPPKLVLLLDAFYLIHFNIQSNSYATFI